MTQLSSDLGSPSSAVEFLRAAPLFASLSHELRADIAERLTPVSLQAGEWLFRQGDPGDAIYFVRSGRVEVVVDGVEPTVLRVLARGEAVGELALLTESSRSASVRARRDSELLKLTRADFADILVQEPEFALALTRELGRRLQVSRSLVPVDNPLPATITLVPLDRGQRVREVGDRLVGALARWGRVALLRPEKPLDPSDYGSLLDRAERDHRQVLLLAGLPTQQDQWTSFCLRQSDRLLVLAAGQDIPPWLERHPRLKGCDLLFDASTVSGTSPAASWLDALEPRAVHTLGRGPRFGADVERLARRLAGRSVGVVLSGGGARGFAHIGVLEELAASGIAIDRVGGCSMGAFVGAMFAMGEQPDAIRDRCRQEFVARNPVNDYTVPLFSLVRGNKARAMLTRTFGSAMIEELERDYFCVSCDLINGELFLHRRGLLFEAVGASMCVPGVFAPRARSGRLLVDGGVLDNLPVEPMAATAEGPVIAVDVTARFLPPEASSRRPRRPRARQWAARSRRAVVGADATLPSLKETVTRAIGIASVEAVENARRRADLLIAPDTGTIGLLEFDQLDHMVEVGRTAARAALATAPAWV